MMYEPLKPNWRIDEDSGVSVRDQIQERVNTEANYAWAKRKVNPPMLVAEFREYLKEIGRKYTQKRNAKSKNDAV